MYAAEKSAQFFPQVFSQKGTTMRTLSLQRVSSLLVVCVVSLLLQSACTSHAVAQDPSNFTIGQGAYLLVAPIDWKRVPPKTSIVETEFSIPAAELDALPGRLTVMGAGGSVAANVDRWYGQFTQPDGSATKDKAVVKTLKIANCTVTLVDLSGTFKDSPGGPFGGGQSVDRPDYRMFAAIIETPKEGSYFLKFYGPGKTVAQHVDGFRTMIAGMVATAK
ncbi:MAG: hypothetical protein DWH98_06030 [Planctomycetota bacterium]|nr:MAG: hypothetical protein DWH98_06030 [Planctomycetota bacterium]